MEVVERVVLPGVPDVVLAGPVRSGTCRVGDRLRLSGGERCLEVTCTGIDLLNWGAARSGWLSIRVSDAELADVAAVTTASAAS